MRMWTDLQRLRRAFVALHADSPEEEQASFELAQSARRFSRRTKDQVDDKLSFSAVLMRAGEVDAANRLIEELERDVRSEEAALIEQMNEVSIARTMRRDRVTRARLARVLVTAIVGASMMAFSAIGMAVAGMFADGTRSAQIAPDIFAATHDRSEVDGRATGVLEGLRRKMRKVKIADTEVLLTPAQVRMLEKITSGDANPAELEHLLAQLQLPPELTAQVRRVLTAASAVAAGVAQTPQVEVPQPNAQPVKKKTKKKAKQKPSEEPQDPNPNPNPSPPNPNPNPDPEPSPGDDEDGDANGGEGGDKGSGGLLPKLD